MIQEVTSSNLTWSNDSKSLSQSSPSSKFRNCEKSGGLGVRRDDGDHPL